MYSVANFKQNNKKKILEYAECTKWCICPGYVPKGFCLQNAPICHTENTAYSQKE